MPRKYHRPPTTVKRRKPRKTNVPYAIPEAPVADSTAVATAEETSAEAEAPRAAAPAVDGAKPGASQEAPVKHITRDYSYVRAEVVRILMVGGFILASLLVAAVLRH